MLLITHFNSLFIIYLRAELEDPEASYKVIEVTKKKNN
jgi:hypothetical protein